MAVSDQSARALRTVCGVTRPIEVRPPLLPDPLGSALRPWARHARTGPVTITTVARLYVTKGLTYLLQAIPQVTSAHPDVRFRIYGDGPLRQELRAQATELGLDADAIFRGAFNTRDALAYQDISVLSAQGTAEMQTPAVPTSGGSYWGIGLEVGEFEGMTVITRVGDTGHFRALLAFVPEKGLGVILLANASGFEQMKSGVVDRIALGVFNMLNDKPAASVSVPFMMHFLYWSILLMPMLQILGIALVWRKRKQMKTWGVALTVILNLAVAISLLIYAQSEMPLLAACGQP